jgi:predicted MFS family arabinose efflux permease
MGLFARVTLPLAAVNFINQASRTMVSLIGPLLALEFGLSASGLGLLAGLFFAAYALTQLPVGVAMDSFGPRRVQAALCALAALGFAASALAPDALLLGLGRFVTGIGVAAGLIALLKAHTQWLPRDQVAGATGLGVFVGGLGALSATLPMQWLLPLIGWRGGFALLAGMALAIAAWVWLSVPDLAPARRRDWRADMAAYGRIFPDPAFRRWVPSIVMLTALNFTYQGLWAGPWLRDVAGLEGEARAGLLFVYALGLMAGSLVGGQAASRLQRRGAPALLVPWIAMAVLAAVQVALILRPSLDPLVLAPLWFVFAFAAAVGPVGYAAVGQGFPPELAGRVATAINTAMLATVFLLQNGIGWVLDLWPRSAAGGWDPAGYAAAMWLTVGLQLAAGIWMVAARGR